MKDSDANLLIESVTEKLTLKIFKLGCDSINFEIIKKLPTTLLDLQEQLDITKMPLNKRINELASVGLLTRKKYEGIVESTKLTESFLNEINDIKKQVTAELPKLI